VRPPGVGKLLLLFVQGNIKGKKKKGPNTPEPLNQAIFALSTQLSPHATIRFH